MQGWQVVTEVIGFPRGQREDKLAWKSIWFSCKESAQQTMGLPTLLIPLLNLITADGSSGPGWQVRLDFSSEYRCHVVVLKYIHKFFGAPSFKKWAWETYRIVE